MEQSTKLDITKAEKKLWLVKVPTFVAEMWIPKCERSMNCNDLESSDVCAELGKIIITASEGQQHMQFQVTGESNEDRPMTFEMVEVGKDITMPVSVLSYPVTQQGKEAAAESTPRMEGYVHSRYDLRPVAKMDGENVLLDKAYCRLSRDRLQRASTKLATVQPYEDSIHSRQRMAAATLTALLPPPKRKGVSGKGGNENKRQRMDRSALEEKLFKLFETQSFWTFQQLQKETQQPAAFLKEVLNEIAVMSKKGPNKDMFMLKKEFSDNKDGEGDDDGGDT